MYFELDDIKRRHSLYWDLYNFGGFAETPDSTVGWMYKRGAIAGVAACTLQQTLNNVRQNWHLLLTKYEPPSTVRQFGIFFKEIMKMDNYTAAMKSRYQIALTTGLFDLAPRYLVWRWVNNGWQRTYGGFEHNFIRKIPGTLWTAAVTSWCSVPFELAQKAYYADKTFPPELQRNYTSYWAALRRIPFEEGPYYLWKNCFPILMRNFFQTTSLFYTFDFCRDKLSFLWRSAEIPYYPCKIAFGLFSTYFAVMFSYPWVYTEKMIDFWPKNADGTCQFSNNYRRAAVWLWYHDNTASIGFPGFFNNYFWKTAPGLFVSLMVADSLGMFTYNVVDQWGGAGNNTWEDSIC